jgi:hypothetical protein
MAACIILCSHYINISMLENKKWADTSEITRLVLLLGLGSLLNVVYDWDKGFLLAGVAMFFLGFSFWIARDFKQRQITTLHAH